MPLATSRVVHKSAALAAVLGLVAAASVAGPTVGVFAHSRPAARIIKVGILAPLTGTAAVDGEDLVNGWNLYWETHPDVIAGARIETVVADTASNPNTALTQARKLVEQDHVNMVLGPFLANEGQAVAPYLNAQHIPFFFPASSSDNLTQRIHYPYFLRLAGWSSSLPSHVAGIWACQHYKTAVIIAPNYAFGWETAGGFAQTYTDSGCTVLQELWPPLGTQNFSPFLSKIASLHPQMVFAEMVGADAGNFLKQWASFGLKGKIPLIGHDDLTGQADIHGVPASDVVGIITFRHYTAARNDPETRAFDLLYAKHFGELPAYIAAAHYTAAEWIAAAIAKLHGNVSNGLALVAALKNTDVSDSPLGPMKMDPYGNPIENVYMTTVEPTPPAWRKYSAAWNVVLKVYPDISQFYPWTASEYLKQPPYTLDFQGIDYYPGKGPVQPGKNYLSWVHQK